MHLRCHFDYYPQPFESNLFSKEMLIDMMCGTGGDDEVVAARLAVDELDIDRAINSRQDIYEICDADSGGWESVFAGLFELESQAEWRKDFKFDEPISHLLFLYRSIFHPALLSWQAFIIDSVASMSGDCSALVMWKGETDLTDSVLTDLGFRVIAGSDLRLRPNMFAHEYSAAKDSRNVLELRVPPSAEDYVISAWNAELK